MDSLDTPTISAIIVTYNRRAELPRAIDSISAQTPRPHEIIIVDDGSTDGTCDYLRERYGDTITLLEQRHSGVSAARRKGVLADSGEWIAFLDSDDAWAEGRQDLMQRAIRDVPPAPAGSSETVNLFTRIRPQPHTPTPTPDGRPIGA